MNPLESYPVDLQLHSTRSDGTDTPAELVALADRLGIQVIALTDHDSVLGVDEALAAAATTGVTVVPALEFSTRSESDRDLLDINILAYGIDHQHAELIATLKAVLEHRVEQKIRQIELLQGYGLDVPVEAVLEQTGGVPGRVHIARVAMERNPGRFASISDVFDQFLAADAPNSTYVTRTFSLRVEDAIELTHAAGGMAVLAHPGSYTRVQDVDGVVGRMAAVGLDGLEVNYTYAHNRGHRGASRGEVMKLIAHYAALADRYGLYKTGGSDYHGTTKPGIVPGMAGLTRSEWRWLAPQMGMPTG